MRNSWTKNSHCLNVSVVFFEIADKVGKIDLFAARERNIKNSIIAPQLQLIEIFMYDQTLVALRV